MIKELFLSCALALPAFNKEADYNILRKFIEKRYPKYTVVFINEDEELLNPGAEKTPVSTVPLLKAFRVKGLRIWMIPKLKRGA